MSSPLDARSIVRVVVAVGAAISFSVSLSAGGDLPNHPASDSTTRLDIDFQALAATTTIGQRIVASDVVLPDERRVDLVLERFAVTSDRTQFVLGGADQRLEDFDPNDILLLRGEVVDHPGSHVVLSMSRHSSFGIIDLGGGARFELTGSGGAGQLTIFQPANSVGGIPGVEVCGIDRIRQPPLPDLPLAPAGGPSTSTQVIDLAIETDYEYFSLFEDVDAATAYVVQLYGVVSDIYLRDTNSRFELTFVRIWETENDLFNEDDPLGPFVDYWNANMDDVDRDVAQFLTGRRNLPYGGVAFVSALCGSSAYSVAGYAIGAFPSIDLPNNGHWDIIVSAHELGHNCGTFHTHDNGIDGCNVGVLQRGTIMSYCHTTSGGNANIDLRFHTGIQPFIEGFVQSVNCVIDDCNGNSIDDSIDISAGDSDDVNGNGVPDECEDCNGNGTLDSDDIAGGASNDLNGNGIPDECEPDCNGNGVPDDHDIAIGASIDKYGDGIPDECDADCDDAQASDYNQIQLNMTLDIDRNAILDACQDCDNDGVTDFEVLHGAHNIWSATLENRLSQSHYATGVTTQTTTAGNLDSPQDVLITIDGRMLVSSADDDRIAEFDLDGNYLGDLVSPGVGGLNEPTMMTISPTSGDLLVVSRSTNQVLAYDVQDGAALGAFVTAGDGGLTNPFGLTFGPNGNLFVTASNGQVLEYDGGDGSFVGVFVSSGNNGGLGQPHGLVFKPDGNLIVASFVGDALLEYHGETGDPLGQWDRGGLDSGFWALGRPWDIQLGPNGNVYVTSNEGNAAIHMYDVDNGAFMRSYYVLEADAMSSPTGFAFIPGDDVDCNLNLIPDICDIASGVSSDNNSNGIPDECESILGDLDGDGVVGSPDLIILLGQWGACDDCGDCSGDLDGDCIVGTPDLIMLLGNWS